MTRLWVLSDLHLSAREIRSPRPLARVPATDVAVVAGDVCDEAEPALRWLAATIGVHMPVVAVLGNHEFWGGAVPTVRAEARRIAGEVGVHLLDDSAVTVAGVRFVGGTLWTDFRLYGPDKGQRSMRAARSLPDYREILHDEVQGAVMPRTLQPRDTAALHAATRAFIDRELAEASPGASVVVTHHAPSGASVPAMFQGHPWTPAFASDLSGLIEARGPALWIHGHVHARCAYRLGRTRVICNPKGYGAENEAFDWQMVIEVDEASSGGRREGG